MGGKLGGIATRLKGGKHSSGDELVEVDLSVRSGEEVRKAKEVCLDERRKANERSWLARLYTITLEVWEVFTQQHENVCVMAYGFTGKSLNSVPKGMGSCAKLAKAIQVGYEGVSKISKV